MPILNLDAIAAADDTPRERVDCPEWNGILWIRCLPARQKDQFDRQVADLDGTASLRALLVAYAACDETGEPAWRDPTEAAQILAGKNCQVIRRLYDVAERLNGLGLPANEAAAKN